VIQGVYSSSLRWLTKRKGFIECAAGNNIKKDFNRFGLLPNVQAANPAGVQWVTDLGHLNDWRNKAAHQGTQPLETGVPAALTLPIVQGWRASCDGLATSLDAIMHAELLRIMGVAPW
jgi:hypothetical protein